MESKYRTPVIVQLGKKKKKKIKELKQGYGSLMDEVWRAASQSVPADGQTEVIPVVVIYEKKSKRGRWRTPLLGGF